MDADDSSNGTAPNQGKAQLYMIRA
jgi:hypothetical protein